MATSADPDPADPLLDDLHRVIGLALRARRRDLRLSQRELARESGLGAATIARLEGGGAVSLSSAQRALAQVGLRLAPVDASGSVWSGRQAIEDDVLGVRDRAGRRHPAHLQPYRGGVPTWGVCRAMKEGRLADAFGRFRGYTFRGDTFRGDDWLDALVDTAERAERAER